MVDNSKDDIPTYISGNSVTYEQKKWKWYYITEGVALGENQS